MALWGGQRIWTKGRRPVLSRGKAVGLAVGEPLRPGPGDDPAEVTAELKLRIGVLLTGLQDQYPQKPHDDEDRWWLPADRGGTAPSLAEATALDLEEAEERRRRRAK
jgi:hypothetical protein